MLARLRKIATNDDGASAVEYGLLVAAIAAVLVLVVFALGGLVDNVFRDTCTQIAQGAGTGAEPARDVPDNCVVE